MQSNLENGGRFPKYIFMGSICALRLTAENEYNIATYYRDAGNWYTYAKYMDGKLMAAMPSRNGPSEHYTIICGPSTKAEWKVNNQAYGWPGGRKEKMKLIIAGSRTITKVKYLTEAIYYHKAKLKFNEIDQIISGGAPGVDRLGESYAMINNIALKRFPANWSKYGKAAGHIRNAEMAEYGDVLLAIWDGVSKGTKNMIEQMKKRNKPVYIYNIKKED